jgi:DNA-binding NarL/FixJ family response regulator
VRVIRVALATTEPIAAHGFAALLKIRKGFHFACLSLEGDALLSSLQKENPDVLLVDLNADLPGSVVQQMHKVLPSCHILLWTHEVTRELANQAMALKASGILRKSASCDLIVRCLSRVAAGELWYERQVTDGLFRARKITLTNREIQLLQLVSQGLSNKEISSVLFLTEGSVKVYLSKLFKKTGVKDRFELGLYGLRQFNTGLLPLKEATASGENRWNREDGEWARYLVV